MKKIAFIFFGLIVCSLTYAKVLINKSKNVQEVKSFWYHEMEKSDTHLLVFNEKQTILIDDTLWIQKLNKWDNVETLTPLKLDSAIIDSHMLYFQKAESPDRLRLVAEVEFDSPIIGFLADGFLFGRTNRWFAPNPTHTQPAAEKDIWSLEEESSWTPLDKVILLSPTRIRIEFTNHSATDPLRVITMRKGKINNADIKDYVLQ